uniref:von Willebrand factor D and EGF domains n=1 Tax=Cyprinus carpio TaxID=7962 RepID=A0A8C2AWB6_CYPCA
MKMAVLCCTSMQLLLVALATLAGICLGGSDGPRGVALPFVFDPKATCEPPCKHAGICIRNNSCFCSRGYEGETCQYGEVSRYLFFIVFEWKVCLCMCMCICESCALYIQLAKTHMMCMLISANCYPKCKNGGECLRPGKCRCPSGFGGKYCHKVACDGGCWNGGECIAVNGKAKCICPSSWTGSRCQDAICPQGCRNGGSCVAPGICSCPEGWIGGACHTAVCKKSCVNGGKCVSPNTCRCRAPFSGPQCEERKKLF